MLARPKIVKSAQMHTAVIHVTVPRSQIQVVMGPGLEEVTAAVAAQGVPVTGPWFTHHLRMDPKVFDLEICLPVRKPVTAAGRHKSGK